MRFVKYIDFLTLHLKWILKLSFNYQYKVINIDAKLWNHFHASPIKIIRKYFSFKLSLFLYVSSTLYSKPWRWVIGSVSPLNFSNYSSLLVLVRIVLWISMFKGLPLFYILMILIPNWFWIHSTLIYNNLNWLTIKILIMLVTFPTLALKIIFSLMTMLVIWLS